MSTTTTTAITISLISNADCVKNGFLLIMIRAAIYGVHLGWQLISEFRHGLHVDGSWDREALPLYRRALNPM